MVVVMVMMSKWIFENMPVITYLKNSRESRAPPDLKCVLKATG